MGWIARQIGSPAPPSVDGLGSRGLCHFHVHHVHLPGVTGQIIANRREDIQWLATPKLGG